MTYCTLKNATASSRTILFCYQGSSVSSIPPYSLCYGPLPYKYRYIRCSLYYNYMWNTDVTGKSQMKGDVEPQSIYNSNIYIYSCNNCTSNSISITDNSTSHAQLQTMHFRAHGHASLFYHHRRNNLK